MSEVEKDLTETPAGQAEADDQVEAAPDTTHENTGA